MFSQRINKYCIFRVIKLGREKSNLFVLDSITFFLMNWGFKKVVDDPGNKIDYLFTNNNNLYKLGKILQDEQRVRWKECEKQRQKKKERENVREKEVTEMEKYQFLLDKIGLVVPLGEILEGWQSNKPPERERNPKLVAC